VWAIYHPTIRDPVAVAVVPRVIRVIPPFNIIIGDRGRGIRRISFAGHYFFLLAREYIVIVPGPKAF
jgi:hypothetical protein